KLRKREIPRRAARLGMTKLEFFRKLFSLSGFGFWRLQGRQAEASPTYSSTNFFLCLGGFRRLSGITRAAGGGPASSRARRLASPPAVNFLGLVLLLLIAGWDSGGHEPLPILPFHLRQLT